MIIHKFLESRMIRVIDAMPYNLTERQMNKLTTKALKRLGSMVAKRFGIENPKLQALVDVFNYTHGIPDFPNEAYISMLKGDEFELYKIGEISVQD